MERINELEKRHYWTEDEIISASHAYDGESRRRFRLGNPAAYSAARRRNLLDSMTWLKDKMVFNCWRASTLADVEKIKWFLNNHGYLIANVNGKDVLKHRLIMEIILGRNLDSNECVHHKDGNKLNNSPDNLEVIDRSDHTVMHNTTTRRYMRGYKCNTTEKGRRIRSEVAKRNRANAAVKFAEKLKTLGMTREEYFKKYRHDSRMKNRDKLIAYSRAYYQSHKEGWNKKRGVRHA